MTYTRRQMLKKIFNPTLWTGTPGPKAGRFELPDNQDIILREDLCIAWGRGICDRCDTACPENAIIFVGMMHPRILTNRCTLCNDCVPICPTDAIVLRPAEGEST